MKVPSKDVAQSPILNSNAAEEIVLGKAGAFDILSDRLKDAGFDGDDVTFNDQVNLMCSMALEGLDQVFSQRLRALEDYGKEMRKRCLEMAEMTQAFAKEGRDAVVELAEHVQNAENFHEAFELVAFETARNVLETHERREHDIPEEELNERYGKAEPVGRSTKQIQVQSSGTTQPFYVEVPDDPSPWGWDAAVLKKKRRAQGLP
jgi:uncharacterized protein YbjQ (UPF0145 family)